ncbi:hypothetical protein [Sorangium sp. So ce204]|uniref:hypothetical protein n=1 Tax=Sorangium sp. So ce204 TaxID=3133288 RepID=UPI003F62CF93
MKQRLEERMKQLQAEYDAGQKVVADLDTRRQGVASTLLRIEGAMQVLREMLEQERSGEAPGAAAEAPPAG